MSIKPENRSSDPKPDEAIMFPDPDSGDLIIVRQDNGLERLETNGDEKYGDADEPPTITSYD